MTVKEMVEEAKRRVHAVSPEELQAEMARGDVVVLDVREAQERWRDGTIPGARSVPRGMLEFWADPESEYHKDWLDPKKRTVLYCAGGLRSALAADALMKLGYSDVAHLEVGYNAYKAAGNPTEAVEKK